MEISRERAIFEYILLGNLNLTKMKRRSIYFAAAGLFAAASVFGSSCTQGSQTAAEDSCAYRDIYPDTWVATDALGRTMPSYEEVGPVKNDQRRVVGIF